MYNVQPPAHKHQQNTDFRICISGSNITSPCIGDIGDVNVFLGGDVGCLNRKPGGAPPIPNCPRGPHITRPTASNTESPASRLNIAQSPSSPLLPLGIGHIKEHLLYLKFLQNAKCLFDQNCFSRDQANQGKATLKFSLSPLRFSLIPASYDDS